MSPERHIGKKAALILPIGLVGGYAILREVSRIHHNQEVKERQKQEEENNNVGDTAIFVEGKSNFRQNPISG